MRYAAARDCEEYLANNVKTALLILTNQLQIKGRSTESRELSIEAGDAGETGVPPTFVEVPAAARVKVENSRLQAVIRTGRTLVEVYEGASGEVISAIIRGLNHAQ